jgi:hypothetical protein
MQPARVRQCTAFACLLVCFGVMSFAWAGDSSAGEDADKSKSTPAAGKEKPEPSQINRKHERAALDFVAQHHSELSDLLGHLKSAQPKKYQQAIDELWRTNERLTTLQKRDADRYALELELWKTKSRIQVLAARLTMSKDPGLEEELLKLFQSQSKLQLEQLEADAKVAKQRLDKLQTQLAAKRADVDDEPQKRLDQLLDTIKRSQRKNKKSADKK